MRDLQGRVHQQTDADGTATFDYDNPAVNGIGRLTSVSAVNPNGPVYNRAFAYDGYGQRAQETTAVAAVSATYTAGKIFDPLGRVVQEQYPDQSVVTRSFSGGNLRSIALNGTPQVTLEAYTPLGQAVTTRYANKAVATVTHLPNGLPLEETMVDATGAKLLDNILQWDGQLNLRSVSDQLKPGGRDYSETLTYAAGRLVGATTNQLYANQAYGYSADGNRTQINDQQLTYQAHRIIAATANAQPILTVAYDPNGNVSARTEAGTTTTYTYDAQNRLSLVQSGGTAQLQNLAYTNSGRRLAKRTPDGTVVVYPFANYEVTLAPGVAPLTTVYLTGGARRYAAISKGGSGTKRAAATPTAGTRYLHANQVRSTTVTLDGVGLLSSRFAYLPFGGLVPDASTGPDDVRPKFQGKEFDSSAQLYYFGARHYDASFGHFLTADTEPATGAFRPDSLNRYAFAANNPATLIDETGHNIFDTILGSIIGAAEVVAGAAIDALSDGALEPLGQGLIGAGINSIQYSATAKNNFSWSKFGDQNAIGFAIGVVTADFGEAGEIGESAVGDAVEVSTQRITSAVSSDIEADAAGSAVRTGIDQDALGVASRPAEKPEDASADLGPGAEEECSLASFTAETAIWGADGRVRIDSLHAGQMILSRNAIDGIDRSRPVTATLSRQVRDMIKLTITGPAAGSERLLVTPAHPIATVGGHWIRAGELIPGTELQTHSGAVAKVVAVAQIRVAATVTVHNVSLTPDHSYFVGANGIWVHNPCQIRPHKGGTSAQGDNYDIILEISKSEYPESAQHIEDAQALGHDDVLTIDRAGAKDNRKSSLRGWATKSGKDRDEYPPAMFQEGGSADIAYISPWDNRASGASFGGKLRGYGNGTRVWFRVIP